MENPALSEPRPKNPAPADIPESQPDQAELVRRVAERVFALWLLDVKIEQERRRTGAPSHIQVSGGRSWRR